MPTAYYTAPYSQLVRGLRAVRVCDILKFETQIVEDEGYVAYAEIDGDQALCLVRAADTTLADLALAFTVVPDPATIWTPTRRTFQMVDGAIVLHPTRTVENKLLDDLTNEVLTDADIEIMKGLADAFMEQAARGDMVRVPKGLSTSLTAAILQRVGSLGFGLDKISPGTFPTTSVKDDFNRADNTTLGANWLNNLVAIFSGTLQDSSITSNQETSNGVSAVMLSFTTGIYGPDCEAYVTVPTLIVGDSHIIGARIQQPGTATYDGYEADTSAAGTLHSYVVTNGSASQIGSSSSGFVNGNKLGLEVIGSTIARYRFSSGSWAQVNSVTDATYASAGLIHLYFPGTSGARVQDDFGGGTVGESAVAPEGPTLWAGGMI